MVDPSDTLHHSAYNQGINRVHSTILVVAVPWLSIMLASLVPQWLVFASFPVLPPFGFLVLLSWRQLRPGLLPVWAGLPLGIFDDLFSGQPFGSATLLWSVAMIAMEVIEARFPWRNFIVDWLGAAVFIIVYEVICLNFANSAGGNTALLVILPQTLLSVLLFPLCGRLVSALDRLRLLRFKVFSQ